MKASYLDPHFKITIISIVVFAFPSTPYSLLLFHVFIFILVHFIFHPTKLFPQELLLPSNYDKQTKLDWLKD